ncbi:MAG: hypothetical protein WHS46_03905 [Desulfosoma sp.]
MRRALTSEALCFPGSLFVPPILGGLEANDCEGKPVHKRFGDLNTHSVDQSRRIKIIDVAYCLVSAMMKIGWEVLWEY